MRQTFEQRLWSRIALDDGCWEWLGGKALGYGQISLNGKNARVHRVVYELIVGPIPEGLHLDHLCRNKGCCRPDHLEPVTNKENVLRGIGPTAVNAVKTHCKAGHPFDEKNTYWRKGWRWCRACNRDYMRRKKNERENV